MSKNPTRRQFLAAASAGAALSLTATSYARVAGANERIALGLIGCGGRGYEAHMKGIHPYDKQENVEFIAVADPWRTRRERAAARCQEWYGRAARQFVSYRDIMDLKDVDAVMIASCDHQHTTHLEAAARAKKDAYCEKPLAMDMKSLKRCCDAVKASGIVAQMGTQTRSYPTSTGCRDLVRSGQLGKISRIEQRRNSSKPYWYSWMQRAEPILEKDVDWKEFLMDRPMRPFDGKLLTGWYGYREFSDGPIANLGCHFLDRNNYIVGTTLPTSCVAHGGTFTWKDENGFTCPDHTEATWIYPEGFMVSYTTNMGNGSGSGERICGELGSIDLANRKGPTYSSAGAIKPSSLPKEDTPVPAVETPDHFLNWLQCLRTRRQPNAPIEAGYNHCVPALMAMRAFDTGRRQVYDAAKREIREG
ncbi:MAG: Gfo/Idh/MocA family oxidoreductase [Planctomycetaceae bacterium]|nr:Gfo/Idh/MocA family oxidoreductase [Planctomycetaceae bacterium]